MRSAGVLPGKVIEWEIRGRVFNREFTPMDANGDSSRGKRISVAGRDEAGLGGNPGSPPPDTGGRGGPTTQTEEQGTN